MYGWRDVKAILRMVYTLQHSKRVLIKKVLIKRGVDKLLFEHCRASLDDYKIIGWTLTIEGKEDNLFPLSQQIELAETEVTSEELRRSSSAIVVNLINGQRKLWSIRGSQMQTFMRMEALARKNNLFKLFVVHDITPIFFLINYPPCVLLMYFGHKIFLDLRDVIMKYSRVHYRKSLYR